MLACINDQNRDVFDFLFAQEFDNEFGPDYKLTKISSLDRNSPGVGEPEDFTYPVRPSYQLQIDYKIEPNVGLTLYRFLGIASG